MTVHQLRSEQKPIKSTAKALHVTGEYYNQEIFSFARYAFYTVFIVSSVRQIEHKSIIGAYIVEIASHLCGEK